MTPKGTPLRNIRVDSELWEASAEVANGREMGLSEVIRRLLRQYVATKGENLKVLYRCPRCSQTGEWANGTMVANGSERNEYWCETCGEESPLEDCERIDESAR